MTELFAVVAVAAIMAAVAIPSMQGWILNNARTSRLNSLVAALNLARSHAIAVRADVTVCRVIMPDPTCDAAGGLGDRWETGWAVRWDANDDGDIADPGDLVRAFDPGMPDNASFRATDGANDIAEVSYGPTGSLLSPPNTVIRMALCDKRGAAEARAVVLSYSGQPRMALDSDGDGVFEVANNDITCP